MFRLTREEAELSRSQSVILNLGRGQNIAEVLRASTDELLCRKAPAARSNGTSIKNRRLCRRMQEIEKLPAATRRRSWAPSKRVFPSRFEVEDHERTRR
ncbi:MAG TPA: hypothetical protein VG994_03995 [Steroidobacteraceae bacterium]|nr:hypothetical protein [Steroidobacteraceae bacterium]